MFQMLVNFAVIPPGIELLTILTETAGEYFYTLIALIILLESIVYVGFYFPGQFFAVLLVVGSNPSSADIFKLTIAMVIGATLGSWINYEVGRKTSQTSSNQSAPPSISTKSLLLAMIHINSLAFFMVTQGALQRSRKIIGLAALLNLPYYLSFRIHNIEPFLSKTSCHN